MLEAEIFSSNAFESELDEDFQNQNKNTEETPEEQDEEDENDNPMDAYDSSDWN